MRVVIIGAGPGGYVAALRAAQMGANVTLVERGALGGVCLNHGCIPTKTLLASVNALRTAREAEKYGVHTGESRADWASMLAIKERVVTNLRKGIGHLLKKSGVNVIEGVARFRSARTVETHNEKGEERLLEADRVIIATGSSPISLRIPVHGLQNGDMNAGSSAAGLPASSAPRLLTSTECLELPRLPATILFVGGGAVGVEFAFIFAALGAQVTIVETLPRILPAEDGEVAEEVTRELRRLKIKVLTDCRLTEVQAVGPEMLRARLSSGESLTFQAIVSAVGRRPNSAELNLDAAGVGVAPAGNIIVTDRMETSTPGIYAIGDVVGGMLLAHKASAEGVVAAENATGGDSRMSYNAIPRCIFTEPQVAAVGLTEEDAKAKGLRYKVGKAPFRAIGKAHAIQKTTGFVKIIAEERGERVLGVHMVGHGVSEMIHEAALVVRLGLDVSAISSTVHAHPTLGEAVYEAALAVQRRSLHF